MNQAQAPSQKEDGHHSPGRGLIPPLSQADLEETINRLMNDHGDGLFRLCYMMLSDHALAEDAVQETFYKAYRAYPRFRHDSSEYTWLSAIAANVCRSMRAKAWFRLVDPVEHVADREDPNTPENPADNTVMEAILALKPRYRDPLLLFYYQGLSTKQAAQALKVAESTLSVRLMRARKQLKEMLKGWYLDEDA